MYFFVVHFASCTFCLYFASCDEMAHAPSSIDQGRNENINKQANKPKNKFRDVRFLQISCFELTLQYCTFD